MTLHHLDGNARAADAFQSWHPEDFTSCSCCGCDFADTTGDDWDPHAVQSKDDPALCQFCADTWDDE